MGLWLWLGCSAPGDLEDAGATPTASATQPDLDMDTSTDTGLVDLVETAPEPDAEHLVLTTPVYEIAPYTEVMYCYVGTYVGPDVGVTFVHPYQSAFGHHLQLNRFEDEAQALPDGTVFECGGDIGPRTVIMFQSTQTRVDGEVREGLPDGMAMYLGSGQQWVLQSHYTNTSGDTLQVQDSYELEVVPSETVSEWVAPWQQSADTLQLPPGPTTLQFDCTWDQEFTILSLWGHMHEWGSSMRIESSLGDDWTTIYEVEDWDPTWTNDPDERTFDPGTVSVVPGQIFRTTCAWDNTTGADIVSPSEMCSIQGVGYSSFGPLDCHGDAHAPEEDDEDDEHGEHHD